MWVISTVAVLVAIDWTAATFPDSGWRIAVLTVAGVFQLIAYAWLVASLVKAWNNRRAQPAIFRRTAAWVGAVAIGAVIVAAGPTLWLMTQPTEMDTAGIESDIEAWLSENDVEAVADCPESMTAERGTSNDCVVTAADGSTGVVEIRWQNDDGEYVMQVAQ